jgi:hypothetical protein
LTFNLIQFIESENDKIFRIDYQFEQIQAQIDKANEFLHLKNESEHNDFILKYSRKSPINELQVYNQEYDLSKELEFDDFKQPEFRNRM